MQFDEIGKYIDKYPLNFRNYIKLNLLNRRCNSFFMDLVSQLCFSDDEPPSNQVVEKLMSHITATTRGKQGEKMTSKEMSVFEEDIDPTPVLRSFLLQHLLRTRSVFDLILHAWSKLSLFGNVLMLTLFMIYSCNLLLRVLQYRCCACMYVGRQLGRQVHMYVRVRVCTYVHTYVHTYMSAKRARVKPCNNLTCIFLIHAP